MINYNDKVAIVACSNALSSANKEKIDKLNLIFKGKEINCVFSSYIFFSNVHAKEKANELMKFYLDKNIKAIFDISGGDIANEILIYLDMNILKKNYKPFFGYSDLTTLINAFYSETGSYQYLYQVRNLIYERNNIERFFSSIIDEKNSLFDIKYDFIKGSCMRGILVGGNIRCLLKLAGTKFMPDFKQSILFLEANSGNKSKIITYLSQLKLMGVFEDTCGILFGTFLELEKKNESIKDIVIDFFSEVDIPIAITNEVGHKSDSKALIIGKEYCFGGNNQ